MNITEFVKKCHDNAVVKGFWDKPRETGTLISLVHSEVTEALDADSCADFCDELADICIRIGDLCGGLDINLAMVLFEPESKDATISDIEKSFKNYPPDFNDDRNGCAIHKDLSYALECDRKNKKDNFTQHIADAFIKTFLWAAKKGYSIEDSIYSKMEKNLARPRLHGKQY